MTELMEEDISKLETEVDELYSLKDHFFSHHALSEANKKAEYVRRRVEVVLSQADSLKDSAASSANSDWLCRYLLARGRLLNVDEQYSVECEHLLTRVVKLQPQLAAAWSELGLCVWKRSDPSTARNCFQRSVTLSESAESLRRLSIVERELATLAKSATTGDCGDDTKSCQIQRSVASARRAVQLDVSDGRSWTILGNALFSSYFCSGQNMRLIEQCLAAYQTAENDSVAKFTPELHYNRAMCYQFVEDYQAALQSFSLADSLEPSWTAAADNRRKLAAFVTQVDTLVRQRGNMKPRKLMAAVESLKRPRLGPYSSSVSQSAAGNGSCVAARPSGSGSVRMCLLSELETGVNHGKLVVGKIVCVVASTDSIAFTFCMVDLEKNCFAVNVYNMAAGSGFAVGDMIAIAEPSVKTVDVNSDGTTARFQLIRVRSPLLLVLNGRRPALSFQAAIECNATCRS